MVSKKERHHRQIAQAAAARADARRTTKVQARRRRRAILVALVVVALLGALLAWILTHDGNAGATDSTESAHYAGPSASTTAVGVIR